MYNLRIPTLYSVYNGQQWYDADVVILHAAFQVLVDFVENELGDVVEEEIYDLYQWWINERPQRRYSDDAIDVPDDFMIVDENGRIDFNKEKYPDVDAALTRSAEQEIEYYQEDTEKLIQLMKIRKYLWT